MCITNLQGALVAGIACAMFAVNAQADLKSDIVFQDDFQNQTLASRRALRGDWKIADGLAKCNQDDELYKKHQNHGPIIFYDVAHTDANISFKYKATGCKTVVFTANGEKGHVFRFVLSERGTNVRAFPPDSEVKSIALLVDAERVLASDWVNVTVKLVGQKATVQLGDHEPLHVEHPSLAQPKTNLSVGFSFGTLAVSEFVIR